jgi:MFS family permease
MIPYEQLAFIMTMPSLVGLVVAFGVGPLSLKVNKKLLLFISACAALCYTLVLGLVGRSGPVELLYAGACLAGITQGSNTVLIGTILNEHYDPEKNATYLSVVLGAVNASAMLSGMAGGAIATMDGGANWPASYLLGLTIIPVMVGVLLLLPKSPKKHSTVPERTDAEHKEAVSTVPAAPKSGEVSAAMQDKKRIPSRVFLMIIAYVIFALCSTVFSFNISTYVITEHQLGTSVDAGLAISMFTGTGMVVSFTYALWSKILRRFVATVGYVFLTGGVALLALFTSSMASVYVAAFCIGIGSSLPTPFLLSKLMEATPSRLVPISMSLAQGCVNLFGFASVMILSFLGSFFGGGLGGRLWVGVIFGAAVIVLSLFLFVSVRNRVKTSDRDMCKRVASTEAARR